MTRSRTKLWTYGPGQWDRDTSSCRGVRLTGSSCLRRTQACVLCTSSCRGFFPHLLELFTPNSASIGYISSCREAHLTSIGCQCVAPAPVVAAPALVVEYPTPTPVVDFLWRCAQSQGQPLPLWQGARGGREEGCWYTITRPEVVALVEPFASLAPV